MRLTLVTPPASEPISLDEAKAFLRLETTADDALVSALIVAARSYVETRLRRSLIATTWDLFLDGFPYGGGYYNRQVRQMGIGAPGWFPSASLPIDLPRPPLVSVTSVKFVDPTGTLQTIGPSGYLVSAGTPGRIQPAYGQTWPVPQSRVDAVQVRFVAGYGADATAVPESVKLAIRLALTHFYENRGASDEAMPDAIGHLLSAEDPGTYS